MTDRIEPALTPEQWIEHREALNDDGYGYQAVPYWEGLAGQAGAIAVANDLLPDSDPRKITRERITLLRDPAYRETEQMAFIDALASYLPPEGT
jgi:hypothetical protein